MLRSITNEGSCCGAMRAAGVELTVCWCLECTVGQQEQQQTGWVNRVIDHAHRCSAPP
jgi:hypothetical protein